MQNLVKSDREMTFEKAEKCNFSQMTQCPFTNKQNKCICSKYLVSNFCADVNNLKEHNF